MVSGGKTESPNRVSLYDNTGSLDPIDRNEAEDRWVLPSGLWLYIFLLPRVSVARLTIRSYQFQFMFMCILVVIGQFQSSSICRAQLRETM